MWYNLFLGLVFFLHVSEVYSQESALKKELVYRMLRFSTNEGLPSSESYFVHQDKSGYIWICTDRGVARYDGFKFDIFNTSNGLPDNVIFHIYEDHLGRIWFISNSGKLSYFQGDKIHVFPHNDKIYEVLQTFPRPVKQFAVDKKGNIYFSNLVNAVLKIYPDGRMEKYRKPVEHTTIFKIQDRYFPLINSQLDYDSIQYFYKGKKLLIKPRDIGVNIFDQIEVGQHVFLRLRSEIVEINDSFDNRSSFDKMTGLFKVQNNLVICTFNGAYFYSSKNGYDLRKPADKYFLKGFKVSHVIQDKDGGYWFSTLDNGVVYIPAIGIENWRYGSTFSENKIFDVFKYKNEVFFSNSNGYFNLKTGKCLSKCAYLGMNLGYELGDKIFLRKEFWKNEIERVGNRIYLLDYETYSPGINNTFLASGYALHRFKTDGSYNLLYKFSVYNKDKQNVHIDCIAETKQGIIYAGNLKGLYKFNGRGFDQKGIPKILKSVRISSLIYDEKNNGLWVGTRGLGVFFIRNGKVINQFTVVNGLIDDQVNTLVLGNQDVVWVSSNSGVSKLERFSKSLIRIQNITKMVGLYNAEVTRMLEFNGKLYLATKGGVSILPTNLFISRNYNKRNISIKSIYIDTKTVPSWRKKIILTGQGGQLKLVLRSTNYRTSFHKKYRYRLGAKTAWSYGSTGEILFNNLEPGEYKLELSYQDEFGNWVKPYSLLFITKEPKFYQSGLFLFLIICSIIGLSILIVVRRNKQLKHKYAQIALIEQLEQKSLIAQINPHFIFNSLNSIQSFLVYNENDKAERFLIKLAKLIRSTLTISRENKITIEMEMKQLTQYLELEKMRFKDKFDFELVSHLTTHEEKRIIPPMLIQPFVENSVLHGFVHKEDHGTIRIEFQKIVNNVLSLTIVDNGLGRSATKKYKTAEHKSYATSITQERLDAFQKKYNEHFYFEIIDLFDEHKSPIGTKVNLKLPVLEV